MNKIKNLSTGKKVAAICGAIIGVFVALLLSLFLILHVITPLLAIDFFVNSDPEYVTPGIYEGLVPQGYAYLDDNNVYLQCGYMADGASASRIYVTNAEDTSDSFFVELYTEDGQPYTGHTGGITSYSGLVWLANDGEGEDNCVWVFTLDELLNSKDGKVILDTKFLPESRAACCFADGEYLWVGEFNDGEKYVTKETHAFGENNALVCAYAIDTASEYGIKFDVVDGKNAFTPVLALSVTDLVQGFTKTPDGFALSTSYSVKASHLYFYSDVTKGAADASISINGKDVPVYSLDNEALIKDVAMPPMSEGIFVKDGRVFVLFESACQKYIFGNFTHGIFTFSYNLPE